jgi:PAS domain S-box-containing protein
MSTGVIEREGGDALRESAERYRTLFDLGPMAVYSIDTSGIIQDFNRRAAELWGQEPAVGDTNQRFCGSFRLLRPDGSLMPHEQCPMADVASGKLAAVHDAEVIIERPDRSRITVLVNICPLKNTLGEVIGAINCFYDITERRQTEEARARLASIVEFSDDAILSKDLNGVITSWNRGAERLFGYEAQEAIGQSVTMLIPADRYNEEPMILQRIRSGDSVEHYETVRRRKDGTLINLSLTVSPIKSAEGKIIGASKIARDITDRERVERALRESQALLADRAGQLEQLVAERTARLQAAIDELEHFSYTITHDMRAPLRAMQGYCGILLNDCADRLTPANAGYLLRIKEASNRMDALIRDSLQYAKVVRENASLAPVEPVLVLRSILESYPSLQPPHMQIQIVEPLPPVLANDAGLGQCFSNFLTNALKFVRPNQIPQVRIWAERRGDLVRFWFEDNGIGIPQEHQTRIFGMFQQLDRSYEGTGIGLALVLKTAKRMEGRVGVESEPGKGSRFWLELKHANPPVP